MDRQYLNGTLWQAPNRLIAVLQYLNDGLFCLLGVQEQALYGHSCLCVITDADGKWQYREDELPARLEAWVPLFHNMLKIGRKEW